MTRVEGRPDVVVGIDHPAVLHLVPPGGARDRWQRELVAELYGLSRTEQARHTLGVVSRALALRAAVTARDSAVVPGQVVVRKPLRCHLHLHSWRIASADDGSSRFRQCRRCGKEEMPSDPGHWMAGGF